MSKELYNKDYLKETAKLFHTLKEQSYAPFSEIKDGIIADVGCGIGADALNLAKMLGNSVQVFGIDYSEEMIAEAKSSAADFENLKFSIGSAEDLPFEDHTLSGIRNERLIQHLINPEKAFQEFYRVLKADSPIVIVETDWNSMSFYNGNPELIIRIKDYLFRKNVNFGSSAISLTHLLKSNHFRNISFKLFPISSNSLDKVIEFTRIDFILDKMVSQNYLTTEEHQLFLNELKNAAKDDYFSCTINLVIASAIK